MNYEKYDVITFEDNEKVVVVDTLEYEGNNYLYVDKINAEETTNLKKFHILRVCEDDYLQKETDNDILMKILPQFNEKLKKENN